jgi:hypothetical protein
VENFSVIEIEIAHRETSGDALRVTGKTKEILLCKKGIIPLWNTCSTRISIQLVQRLERSVLE